MYCLITRTIVLGWAMWFEIGEILLAAAFFIFFLVIGAHSVRHVELMTMRLRLQLVLNYNMGNVLLFSDTQAEVLKVN